MPILKLSNGVILASESKIQQELACLNVQVKTYESGKSLSFGKLMSQDVLSYAEKEEILQSYVSYFESCNLKLGNVCYDLLVLHPGSPNLYSLTATYSRYHTHTDAEELYILSGEVIFGFVQADGSQIELLLQPHDYIHISPGCEHWFSPTGTLHCKALRCFTTADGWIPQHTCRTVDLGI
jgi:1,2-dihydroxy-3-keto-5-methylthiopentene dioxygenase